MGAPFWVVTLIRALRAVRGILVRWEQWLLARYGIATYPQVTGLIFSQP